MRRQSGCSANWTRRTACSSVCVISVCMGCPELGYVSLAELETVRGPFGLPVERDQWFEADRPLSAYAREASAACRITV